MQLFKAIGIEVEKDKDGFLTLSHYSSHLRYDEKNKCYVSEPDPFHSKVPYLKLPYFIKCGIDENRLLEKVKRIKGNADFNNCYAHVLENLESIDGNVKFHYSRIEDLPKLKRIGGNADFTMSHVKTMGNLESVEGDVTIVDSELSRLGDKFKRIGGNAVFDFPLTDLGGIEYIGGDVISHWSLNVANRLKNIKIDGKADIFQPEISDEERIRKHESIMRDSAILLGNY